MSNIIFFIEGVHHEIVRAAGRKFKVFCKEKHARVKGPVAGKHGAKRFELTASSPVVVRENIEVHTATVTVSDSEEEFVGELKKYDWPSNVNISVRIEN